MCAHSFPLQQTSAWVLAFQSGLWCGFLLWRWSQCGIIPAGVSIEPLIPALRQVVENQETKNGLSEKEGEKKNTCPSRKTESKEAAHERPSQMVNMDSIVASLPSRRPQRATRRNFIPSFFLFWFSILFGLKRSVFNSNIIHRFFWIFILTIFVLKPLKPLPSPHALRLIEGSIQLAQFPYLNDFIETDHNSRKLNWIIINDK